MPYVGEVLHGCHAVLRASASSRVLLLGAIGVTCTNGGSTVSSSEIGVFLDTLYLYSYV